MTMKSLERVLEPLMNQTVSGASPVLSGSMSLRYMAAPDCAFLINVGAGLTATFQIMVSMDNKNFYNSGAILPSASGSAVIFPAEYTGPFPWVAIQVTPSLGSGSVLIQGHAKGTS